MFQFRRFPWYTYLFSIPCYIFNVTDCSIRTSADQYLLAIPRSFSQLTASFIGSQCQGILPALLLAWPFWFFQNQITCFCETLATFKIVLRIFTVALILESNGSELCLSHYEKFYFVVFLPRCFTCVRYYTFFLIALLLLYSVFKMLLTVYLNCLGGHKWTRTTDLTLIRRAL